MTAENHRLRLESRQIFGTKGMKVIKQEIKKCTMKLSEEEEILVFNESLNIYLRNE